MEKPEEQVEEHENHCPRFASRILRDGKHALVMSKTLEEDYRVLTGGAFYLKSFSCAATDLSILQGLTRDMAEHAREGGAGFIEWSKHHKFEDPDAMSAVFRGVVARMARYFDVEVYATRLNYYADASDWKPFHHDSHAGRSFFEHGGKGPREDFTMGASFGESRELAFLHVESQARFSFPQDNGDVFAFDSRVNKQFQHGVPKSNKVCGPRFSIIAWGRRVRLTSRNGGTPDDIGTRDEAGQLVMPPGHQSYLSAGYERSTKENKAGPAVDVVAASVEAFVAAAEDKQARSAASTGKNGKQRNARLKK